MARHERHPVMHLGLHLHPVVLEGDRLVMEVHLCHMARREPKPCQQGQAHILHGVLLILQDVQDLLETLFKQRASLHPLAPGQSLG